MFYEYIYLNLDILYVLDVCEHVKHSNDINAFVIFLLHVYIMLVFTFLPSCGKIYIS